MENSPSHLFVHYLFHSESQTKLHLDLYFVFFLLIIEESQRLIKLVTESNLFFRISFFFLPFSSFKCSLEFSFGTLLTYNHSLNFNFNSFKFIITLVYIEVCKFLLLLFVLVLNSFKLIFNIWFKFFLCVVI